LDQAAVQGLLDAAEAGDYTEACLDFWARNPVASATASQSN
jgi:hypothetical protein